MLSNKVSLEGDGGQFDEQDTLVVQIKRWSREHALLLGPTVVEMKEENKFADVFCVERTEQLNLRTLACVLWDECFITIMYKGTLALDTAAFWSAYISRKTPARTEAKYC